MLQSVLCNLLVKAFRKLDYLVQLYNLWPKIIKGIACNWNTVYNSAAVKYLECSKFFFHIMKNKIAHKQPPLQLCQDLFHWAKK